MRYWQDAILDGNHALICGCSGSGKSNVMHSLICQSLTRGGVVGLVLIDLKKVELSMYRNLPHVMAYADTIETAWDALKYVLWTIDTRLDTMQRNGQRKSTDGNIYVFIDEYADLVLTDKRISEPVQRISQIGRAANVHLILATQRPCSEVIKGAIKVNLEVKLALRCMTAQDSRNILGVKGAELLPRYGKGILQENGYNYEIDISYCDDNYIRSIVNIWEVQKCQTQKRKHRTSILKTVAHKLTSRSTSKMTVTS